MTAQYKILVLLILQKGARENCRNGSQLIIPHHSFTIDFGTFGERSAKLHLRKMWYKGIIGEFKTLIDPTPLTNVSQFEANGCNYWKKWAAEDGSINIDYANQMHPQLENVIKQIKVDPASRRHIINLWNPENVADGSLSLPCCWYDLTFSVINNRLHLKWTQRSVDTMIGLPADVYLAYLFMEYIAKATNLKIGSCMFSLSNVHIYSEHIEKARELLLRNEDDFDKPLYFELKE